jgi:hypothetical protein
LGRLFKAALKKRVKDILRRMRDALPVVITHAIAYALGHTSGSLLLALIWDANVRLG